LQALAAKVAYRAQDSDIFAEVLILARSSQRNVFTTEGAVKSIIAAASIKHALAWARESDAQIRILLPFHLETLL